MCSLCFGWQQPRREGELDICPEWTEGTQQSLVSLLNHLCALSFPSTSISVTNNLVAFSQRAFSERKEQHVAEPEAQLNSVEYPVISRKDGNEHPERGLARIAKASSPRRQVREERSGPCRKCHRVRKRCETAFNALRRTLKQQPLDEMTLIVQTIQILAAARRPLTVSELNIAGKTRFSLLRYHQERTQLSRETLDRITNGEVDYFKLCKDLLQVDSSGNVEFSDADLRRAVSLTEFRQQFGLCRGDETLTAICIQHLGCGEQTDGMASTDSAVRCPVVGQASCTFRSYATLFWKKHYLATNGGSPWIHSLLHETLVSTVASDGCANVQCQQGCNRMLATGLEVAATHDLHVLGRTYIEMGAEVGSCSHSSYTPLHIAVANSSTNMIKLLLEYGANPNVFADETSDSLTPLCDSSEGALPTALVGCGPGGRRDDCHCWRCCDYAAGRTPLHVAAAMGGEEMVRLLIAGGACIDTPTMDDGDTALHLAARSGNIGAVRLLIQAGADVRSRNFAGKMAAQEVVEGGHYSVTELLQSVAACQGNQQKLFGAGVAHVEAGVGQNCNIYGAVSNMQHLSLEDEPRESPTRTLGEGKEATTDAGGTWVVV